ncbi:hypothetical protein AA0N74_08090 [Chromobacterium vaccinii]|uniref:hypothetical protein n=1 Tax=Chromobacterium vaccinii TaxID=1108595 RepID=UPI0031DA2C14
MAFDFGSFGIGLMNGAGQGIQLGQAMRGVRNQAELEEIRRKGMDEAQQQRDAEIQRKIEVMDTTMPAAGAPAKLATPVPGSEPQPDDVIGNAMQRVAARSPVEGLARSTAIAPSQGYQVSGQRYDNRDDAAAAAAKDTPDIVHFFNKNAAPMIYAKLLEQGDPKQAEAWQGWIQGNAAQERLKIWGDAYRAAQMGDWHNAADGVFKLYGQYDDGITPISKEAVTDKAGNLTGFNVVLKNKAGEQYSQFVDRDSLREMGLSALSEPQFFQLDWHRQQEQAKNRNQVLGKLAEGRQKFSQEAALEGIKGKNRLEQIDREGSNQVTLAQIKDALDAARPGPAGKKIEDLRNAGYSDEEIYRLIGSGISETKRAPHPDDVKLTIFRNLAADVLTDYPEFGKKKFLELNQDQQRQVIQRQYNALGLIGDTPKPAARPARPAPTSPQSGGLPLFDPRAR